MCNKKPVFILIMVILISSVAASQFIGSFTVKETEQESPITKIKNFLKDLPIVGQFSVIASFGVNGIPECYFIPDQETFKNTPLILNFVQVALDPNIEDILTYELNFTYENLDITKPIEVNYTDETIALKPRFNFVGIIDYIVLKATDQDEAFCYSNPFKLTVKETEPPKPQNQQQTQSGGSSSGGESNTRRTPNFILNKNILELKMHPLEEIEESVRITNTGDTRLNIKLVNLFPGFVHLITKDVFLNLKETKQADFLITAPDIEPDIYLGKIQFVAEGVTRVLSVVITILDEEAEILMEVLIPDEYKRVNPGREVQADVIMNIQDIPKEGDIQYQIRDLEGKILVTESEHILLREYNNKIRKSLKTKESFEPGVYQFFAKIESNEKEYVATDLFEITLEPTQEKPGFLTTRNLVISSTLVLLIIITILIKLFIKSKLYKQLRKKLKTPPKPEKIKLTTEQIRILTISKLINLYKTIDQRDYIKRYILILNEFLKVYYSITYRFTMQEAIKEIRKHETNKNLIKLLDEIGLLFYMKKQPTPEEMKKIIANTINILKSEQQAQNE